MFIVQATVLILGFLIFVADKLKRVREKLNHQFLHFFDEKF